MGLNRPDHDRLRLSTADVLTEPEAKEVIAVRSEMTASRGQVMTKVLHPDMLDAYLDNVPDINGRPFNADQVAGFVARGKDVADFRTPSQLRDGLALDDGGAGWTPIKADADRAYQLRYRQPDEPDVPIAFGGRSDAVAEHMKTLSGNEGLPIQNGEPFLGTGYTGGGGVPEFLSRGVGFDKRAEIWQVNRDGSESLLGVFNEQTRQWARLKP